MAIIQYFRRIQNLPIRESHKILNLKSISKDILDIQIEQCFYIDIGEHDNVSSEELKKLEWLLTDPLNRHGLSKSNYLDKKDNNTILIEVGPR
jgi:hypothetical protein